MASIHGWFGLCTGWILFVMFATGTAAFFRYEISQWMMPEANVAPASRLQAAETAVRYLSRTAPHADSWTILLPDDRLPFTRVFAQAAPKPGQMRMMSHEDVVLDPVSGEAIPVRATRGGDFFYWAHFELQLPNLWGRWVAGLCAMALLGALVSGVITHKRLFSDFFTLRWSKGQRSWLDAHIVTSVLALPFHVVITYSGLVTLMTLYMPFAMSANYVQPTNFMERLYARAVIGPASGRAAPLPPLAPLFAQAAARWEGHAPGRVVIGRPGDEAATVTLARSDRELVTARIPLLRFTRDGRITGTDYPPGAGTSSAGVLRGIHMGRFANPVLRWMYIGLSIVGTAMVATGMLLWVVARRRPKSAPTRSPRLAERVNVAVIGGFPSGVAALFLANRLLPIEMPSRAAAELWMLAAAWASAAAVPFTVPAKRAWPTVWAAAAFLYAAVPIANALTTDRGLVASLAAGDWAFAGFDATMILIAACAATGARLTAKIGAKPAPQRRAARTRPEPAVDA